MNKKVNNKFHNLCEEWYKKNRPSRLLYPDFHNRMKPIFEWMSENNFTEEIFIIPKIDRETNKLFYTIQFTKEKEPEISDKSFESFMGSCNVTAPMLSLMEKL